MKNTVTLDIAGTQFRLVADADAQHLDELAAMVNQRAAKLQTATARPASAAQLLALVALGLADDLTNSEKKLRAVENLTRSTIENAITRIDGRLAGSQPDAGTPAEASPAASTVPGHDAPDDHDTESDESPE